MIERLELIKARYDELSQELLNPELMSDYNNMKKISKEHSDLEVTVKKYEELVSIEEEIKGLKDMVNDPEMASIAKEELVSNEARKEELIK